MLTIISGPPNSYKSAMARGAMHMALMQGFKGLYIDTEGYHLHDWQKTEMTHGYADRVDRLSMMTFPGVANDEIVMGAIQQSAKDGVKLVVVDTINHIFVGKDIRSGLFDKLVLNDFKRRLEEHSIRNPYQRIIVVVTTTGRMIP